MTWQDMNICKVGGKENAANSDQRECYGLQSFQSPDRTATLYFYLKKESDTALIIIIRVRNAITEENDTRKLTQGFQSTWT